MNADKLPVYQSKLKQILTELIGDVEKTVQSRQEEVVEPAADISDGAADAYSLQLRTNLGEQDWQKLKQVQEALEKINNGQYGICSRCEQAIPEPRLDVVPFAEYCVQCLSEIENEKDLDNLQQNTNRGPLN